MTVRLIDIANAAGVSKSTASRALSRPDQVNEKTRQAVEKAARKMNYVFDGVARALTMRETRTIGAIVPTLENSIYAISMQSLERELAQSGYTLLLASHEFNLNHELSALESLLSRGIDAVVLVGLSHRPRALSLLKQARIPVAYSWNHPSRQDFKNAIGFDNHLAGECMAEYLISLGHQRIGVISGVLAENDRATDRLNGVREAIRRAGLSLQSQMIIEKPYSLRGGQEGMAEMFKLTKPPTAVICGNDILAIGAMAEARRLKIKIPKEISVTGFDDMEISSVVNPSLTTIRFPMSELGVNVAKFILSQLGKFEGEVERNLGFELIKRESTSVPED